MNKQQVMDRLKWSKFGEAKKNIVCWSVGEAVEIEITHPELKTKSSGNDDIGTYIYLAYKLKWPSTDISRLKETDRAIIKATFLNIFKRREEITETELQSKHRSDISAIETKYTASIDKIKKDLAETQARYLKEYNDRMDKIRKTYPQFTIAPEIVVIKPSVKEVVEPVPKHITKDSTDAPVNLGIRGRFNAKLAERKQQEFKEASDTPEKSATSGLGLSARLKQMKQDKQENEQDSTLFVSNISEDSEENDIRNALLDKFNVRRVNLVRKAGQKTHSGIGFVVLSTPTEAARCLEFLNGFPLNHLILCATFSKQRD